ncbi:syntaxin-17 isoform X1 [Bombyx mandarina]|uniref:Syntaxin-17 isoform X1 n=1 Tax=Bombyx mandarina TaxID=7092 RepID=A0A6J2JR47_BOMMA|nr:syntaxin-17 isoform X1 [Bombyx mandarina]
MEEEDKLPLKRVEFSLTKFNEVAIPHHLDLLRQHKANIIKYEEGGEYARVRSEQTHARRVASQLRALLGELEALRRRVRVDDLPRFDALTRSSRDNTLKAIMDYLGIIESSCRALVSRRASSRPIDTSPLSANRRPAVEVAAGSAVSSESVGVLSHHDEVRELELSSIQLQVNDQESSLREREAALRGWCELQGEVRALHEAWQHVQAAALHHRHQVSAAAAHVEAATGEVRAARQHLSAAERIKAGALGASGAIAGALVGGPVGVVVGIKAGALAALAGSALGYLGGRVLAARQKQPQKQE